MRYRWHVDEFKLASKWQRITKARYKQAEHACGEAEAAVDALTADLDALDETQRRSEAEATGVALSGAAMQLLGVTRRGTSEQRKQTQGLREECIDDAVICAETRAEALMRAKGAERHHEQVKERRRAEHEKKLQRELDDFSNQRSSGHSGV